ncbi:IclR family transcriptional regulator C-terminal domain-containing protein [Streptomyces sp. NPDC006430]|uniref:IclR family transcriptional regulator domain-containing protein n=1 Tax=Streptomyces sp. NPDC006430 TaxID=3154299 RepID=UPI0033A54273
MRPRDGKEEHGDDATRRSLAEFLARAGVRDRYPHYDLGAAEARLVRASRLQALPAPPRRRAHAWSDPARDCPLDSERARHDLKAVCLAVVSAPAAQPQLTAFIESGHTDLAGSVVFGCLLHVAGLRDGARFWWQFAAGSGRTRTAPAAYCLFLDHSRRGEHHDARVWARELGRRGYRPSGHRDLREVRLCTQAAVLRYVDQPDDPDLGPVPLPRPGLPAVLAEFRPPPPVPAEPVQRAAGPVPVPRPTSHAAARPGTVRSGTGEALAQARRALAVVRILERHPLGVRACQLRREADLAETELRPLLAMLCEEEYAYRPGTGVYARGPALDRLGSPGGGLATQLQSALALARDSAGAGGAVYLSGYADGPGTPPVQEWVDFKATAHASAVGTCLLTRLDPDRRRDHVASHRPARLTPRTITDSQVLFTTLDALAPGAPVFDLREYSPGVVCSAVPITTGDAAGSLALSLPAPHAHRLPEAMEALRRKAVPVLLALLLSGVIPPDAPDATQSRDAPVVTHAPRRSHVTPETLRHFRRLFRTPLTRSTASTASPAGPHLVSDTTTEAAYFFDPLPETGPPRLALPLTFGPLTPGSLPTGEGLVILST